MDIESLQKSQSIAAEVLANIDATQLEQATPCQSWNVSELIDHMIGAQHWSRCAMAGLEMTETGEGSSTGDFGATFASAAAAARDVFEEDGALDRMVNPGFGDMPGSAMLGLAVTDTFTHAWDLAKATGQDTNLDAGIAQELLEVSRASIQDSYRGPEGAPFGPEQEAPEGAAAADQLAAFLGRDIG